MKTTIKTLAITFFTACLLSSAAFAQNAPGNESGGGSGTPPSDGSTSSTPPPLVYTFKRNNGNGLGVCGGDAQIRVAFEQMPTTAANTPVITEIWYDDGKNASTKITSVQLPIYGDITDKTQPYVSYCITGIIPSPGNSQGNINPAIKLTLVFGTPTTTTPVNGTANGIDITPITQ